MKPSKRAPSITPLLPGLLDAGTPGATPAEDLASPLDQQFADLLVRLNGAPDPTLHSAARFASVWRAAGHICVPLARLPGAEKNRKLAESLLTTKVVGRPGEWKPLILDAANRLYLQRYWAYEHSLALAIRARLVPLPAMEAAALQAGLKRLFGESAPEQRRAAEVALSRSFSLITGGPGTGKTRVIARILALLHAAAAQRGGKPLRVEMAAPTGKAAARVTQSIRAAAQELHDSGWALPDAEAVTLHRLLGLSPNSPTPRYHAKNQLTADVLIVDEASMVDLPLMAKLFAAASPTSRIILLGDKDQLASVDAGRVLGDLCLPADADASAPLAQAIVQLTRSYRFLETSGIGQLSRSFNEGDASRALAILGAEHADVTGAPLPSRDAFPAQLQRRVLSAFRELASARKVEDALALLEAFRLLCAVRRGTYGSEMLNQRTEEALTAAGLIHPEGPNYHGRPITITENDYTLRLFNGDSGILWRDEQANGALRAFFPTEEKDHPRRLLPSQLPAHETAWATTVHKSQGSEFAEVLLILPDEDSNLLTRELLYTAITRARKKAEIWYREDVLRAAIQRRTERFSGLQEALWGSPSQSSGEPL